MPGTYAYARERLIFYGDVLFVVLVSRDKTNTKGTDGVWLGSMWIFLKKTSEQTSSDFL